MNLYQPTVTGSLSISGSVNISGSLTIAGGGTISGTASLATTASYANNAELLDGLDSTVFTLTSSFTAFTASQAVLNGKYATTSSNTFTGQQYVTNTSFPAGFSGTSASLYTDGGLQVTRDAYFSSSLYIKGNLTVYGTESIAYITSSQLNIATNLITVNTATPSIRFGGLAVQDSGSVNGLTGSLLWDSQNNTWIYSNPSGSGNYDSAMVLMGPQNSSGLGNEVGITFNALPKGAGSHHMTSSAVFDVSGSITIGNSLSSNHSITGSLSVMGSVLTTGSITANGGLISAGSPNGYPLGELQFNPTTAGSYAGISTNGTTTPTLYFDHRATSNTGQFVFRNGTGGANTLLTIAGSGVATFSNDITGKGAFNGYAGSTQNLLIDWSAESQVTTLTATNLFFGTNAQRRMTISGSNGYVGIGTSSPIAPLHIYSSNQNMASDLSSSYYNGKFRLEPYNTSGVGMSMGLISPNVNYLQAGYSNGTQTAPFVMQPYGGSVGIGTTSPSALLHLSIGNNNKVFYTTGATTGYQYGQMANTSGNFIFGIEGSSSGNIQTGNSAYSTNLTTGTATDLSLGTNQVERMRITSAGNVGIGLSSPGAPLEVKGTVRVTTGGFQVGKFGYASNPLLSIGLDQPGFGNNAIVNGWGNSSNGGIAVGTTRADGYAFTVNTSVVMDSNWQPSGSGNYAFVVQGNTNVGINTPSPNGLFEIGNVGYSNSNTVGSVWGGELINIYRIAQGTWTTFASVTNSSWAGITELNWVGTGDYNRSGAAYLRWAYNGSSAGLDVVYTLYNNSQNATATFRNSSGNLQINISGGAADYWLQVRVLGSRAS